MRFGPAGKISGELTPPPDKSISHRAALLAAMSDGEVSISNYLDSEDTRSTLEAVRALGATVDTSSAGKVQVRGAGIKGAHEASIDVGNAGTLMRLLPGWLAGQPRGSWTIDGDESVRRRPMDRVADPLRRMGAQIELLDHRLPPVTIGGAELRAIEYELPVASAQVKSCILLAGLLAEGETTVIEPVQSRDHTERMLAMCGVYVGRESGSLSVSGIESLKAPGFTIPADFSSAAYFMTAASLVPNSQIRLNDVGLNPTRTGLRNVMKRMRADISGEFTDAADCEPLGKIEVRHARLAATTVEPNEVPLLIDELPLVALLGVFAEGTTTVTGAQELRHKESDRIATVVEGLRDLGATIEATADGFVVEGTGRLAGGVIDSRGDHRLAMLGAVAGLVSRDGVEVRGFEAAAVSYPGFAADVAVLAG